MDGYLVSHAFGGVKIYVKRLPMLQNGTIPEFKDAFVSSSNKTKFGNSGIVLSGIAIKESALKFDSVKVNFNNPRITGGIELNNVREFSNNRFGYGNSVAASLYVDGVKIDAQLLSFDSEKAVFSGVVSAVIKGMPNISVRFDEWTVYHDGRIESLKCDLGSRKMLYQSEEFTIRAQNIELFSPPPPGSSETAGWIMLKRPTIRLQGKIEEQEIDHIWINTATAEYSFGNQDFKRL